MHFKGQVFGLKIKIHYKIILLHFQTEQEVLSHFIIIKYQYNNTHELTTLFQLALINLIYRSYPKQFFMSPTAKCYE